MAPSPDDERLRQTVNELMMARDTAEDPIEAAQASKMIESSEIAQKSPMAQIASEVAAAGRGQDTTLAHLTPGEVVLPPEMMESDEFERAVEDRFEELNLDPAKYVVGMGIASLNPVTGLEEFGFFKKIGKSIKKFAKKIAPVAGPLANFIPGVGPVVAGVIGAATNVAGGKGLKGAISGGLGGFGTGKILGGIAGLGGGPVGKAFTGMGPIDKIKAVFQGGRSGIASLFGGGEKIGLSALSEEEIAQLDPSQLSALKQQDMLMAMQKAGISQDQFNQIASTLGITDPTSDDGIQKIFSAAQKVLPNLQTGQDQNILQKIGGALGIGSGEGQVPVGRALGIGGIGALLAKLAFDEAKNRRGVPLTPLTQETATGRYNIEAEIARRMGKEAPNPVEFGLLPEGTIPQLTAGRQAPQRNVPQAQPTDVAGIATPPRLMMGGGMVMPMAYAKGGNVAAEEFKRMNGEIDGPGTETSDDIPAMLSDGEFVMKSQAVRGAGAFDMTKKKGGIVELRPTREEDRERGTKLMYDMMDLFAGRAKASA